MSFDIYGGQRDNLEAVMKDIVGRVEKYNAENKARTGEGLYEHLACRIKSEESMAEKCRRKGLPETPESALVSVTDAVGLRIVTTFVDDVYKNAELIKGFSGCTVVREKDYIAGAKPNGYRSYHMILLLEEPFADIRGNVPGKFYAEVQIRTIAMDSWAALEHRMSYKKDIPGEELIRAELKRCADELAACDISMQTIRELISNV